MKKFITMIMVGIMAAASSTACKTSSSVGNEPQYSSEKEFEIGMWVGVSDKVCVYDSEGKAVSSRMLTDTEFLEKYKDIADCGINIAFPGYDVMLDGGNYNIKALRAAKEVGIKHVIGDSRLRGYLLKAKDLYENGAKTEDEIVSEIKNIILPYTSCDASAALYGFMIQDEPSAQLFEALGYAQKVFKLAAPDLMFYVNLFPVIAGGAQLAGSDKPILYEQYLGRWFSTVQSDYISYDHYPLYGDGVNTSIESSFLYNMDLMQTKIKDEGNNRKLWTFLQSIQYGTRNRKLESEADAAFQAYSFIAYGGNGIQWFCYAAPPENDGATHFEDNAIVSREYEKNETYDYVMAVNKNVQSLMKYLGAFSWKGVVLSNVYDDTDNFGYLEDSENIIRDDKTLKSFSSTEDAFTGVFVDEEGREGYMVVNFTDPAKKIKNKVKMEFKNCSNAIIVKNGEKKVVKLNKGQLTLNMDEGEGSFVIPY